jgi:hypothetical protein
MSQNAHLIMYMSDSVVGAERFLRCKMLTHFDDILSTALRDSAVAQGFRDNVNTCGFAQKRSK